MEEGLLRFVLFLAYGPFLLTVVVFGIAYVLKLAGNSEPLDWLGSRTEAQKPVNRG
jgi:hypothetical protein